ncbi:ABC transporter permease [Spirillospora sp. NPDC047279]|uniref:ABC transporter permease n=1 Tax=Spirillospora sp. NPDC047279 TaxID=3155478 RepID=UPI0033C1781B
MIAVIGTFALIEYRALVRARFPFVWFLVLPAVTSAILGPAVAGLSEAGATGRVTVGFGVMFSYMTVNYVGRALYREFDTHTWRRTATAAPPKAGYLLGKCLPVLTVGLGQLLVFATFAVTVLGLPLRAGAAAGIAQLMLVLVPFAITGVATGALLYTVIRRAEVYFSLTYLILMVLGALGGAIVASPQLPGWSQAAGLVTPHFWAMRAVDEATLGTGDWSVVLESSALLFLFGAALTALAAVRLDPRKERYAI